MRTRPRVHTRPPGARSSSGVEYNRHFIRWLIDGVETYRMESKRTLITHAGRTTKWCPFQPRFETAGGDEPFSVIFSMAVGGGFLNGDVRDVALPQTMKVDW